MRSIVISKEAAARLYCLLQYLESEWSVQTKDNYLKTFDKAIQKLRTFPDMGQRIKIREGLRRLLITKHSTVYYHYDAHQVTILRLFDTRMNPDRLQRELGE